MKGILKDKLDQVEVPVSDHLWTNVSAQISGQSAAATASTSAISAIKAVAMGVAAMAVVGVGVWWSVSKGPSVAAPASQPTQVVNLAEQNAMVLENPAQVPAAKSVTESKAIEQPAVLGSNPSKEVIDGTVGPSDAPRLQPDGRFGTPDPTPIEEVPFEVEYREGVTTMHQMSAIFTTKAQETGAVQFSPRDQRIGTQYAWDFGDGHASNEPAPAYTYEKAGSYYVTLTVTNEEGEALSSGQTVDIERRGDLQVANIITPNGDGYNDEFDPAAMQDGAQIDYLLIMNARGERIYESSTHAVWDGRLGNGDPAPSGVYIYLLRGKDKNNGIIEKSSKLTVKR